MHCECYVEPIKVDIPEVTFVDVPSDEGRAFTLGRRTQENAGAGSRTVARLEVRSVQSPLFSHDCVSFAVEVD
jgi:hypothetical protein